MDQLVNAANAMNQESTINMNGTITNNKNQEDTIMNENVNYGEVVLEQEINEDLLSLVEGALTAAKYSNIPSFFNGKELVKSADMSMYDKVEVYDAMYGKYKDPEKEDFAAVSFVDEFTGELKFAFVSREGKDFIRRLVDICKAKRMSMKKLLSQVGKITFEMDIKMKKGHENEVRTVLDDGTNNWFYTYNFEINK